MRTSRWFLALFLTLILPGGAMALGNLGSLGLPAQAESGMVPDEFIVVLADGVPAVPATDYATLNRSGLDALDLLALSQGVDRIAPQFPGAAAKGIAVLSRHYKVRLSSAADLTGAMDAFAADPLVERVEPIGIHPVHAMPNDGFFGDQWHLDQTNDHDVDAPEAWDIETGDGSIIAAVLDTGVRYYHKDLGGVNASSTNPSGAVGNMWINWAEKNGIAGVDDDGNGYVDDWVGYDFVDGVTGCWSGEDCSGKDNDPRDFNGHGTHCAGNIGAMNNNGYATCAPSGGWDPGTLQETGNGVKVMACRVGWSGSYGGQEVGYVRMDFAAEAFYYAAGMGVRIASCSWGSSNSGGIDAAATYFINQGGLIFKAAGNDGGQTADYLCARSDVVSVAATDQNDCKASFSTYGTWVDISAPGVDILSSYHDHADPASDYVAAVSGTSMATPLAASVAALIWSHNPGWTGSQVLQQLYASADPIDGLSCNSSYSGKLGAGRVNAYQAVQTGTPAPVAQFSGSPTSGCGPLSVAFTDASSGEITSWSWDFGDGQGSAEANPLHTYNLPGLYTVTLTVTGPGGSDSEIKTGYITVRDIPAAGFSAAPLTGSAPLTVSFTDLSSGSPSAWAWEFGDGGVSSQRNPQYTYAAPGDYTVTLTVSNECGSDVLTRTNYIHVDEPSPYALALEDIPVAGSVSGTYAATHASDDVRQGITEVESRPHPRKWYSTLEHQWRFEVPAGDLVTFHLEAYRTTGSDGDNFVFAWSADGAGFQDLVTVASATEQHYSMALPGGVSGTVYVRVRDTARTDGGFSFETVWIDRMYFESATAEAPPVADFSGTPTSGYAPLTVQFTDLSTNGPDSWTWGFGDGGVSGQQNPAHVYNAPGVYTVTLTAANSFGSDVETKSGYITVLEPQTGTMHVQDIVVTRKYAGPNQSGLGDVLIVDSQNQPVSGATVVAVATGPVGGSFNGLTDATGWVRFETGKTRNPSGEWCFEVTGVTHGSLTYDPAANLVTKACESGVVYEEGDGPERFDAEPFGLSSANFGLVRGSTQILYHLEEAGQVVLEVYDVTGKRVRTLASGWNPAGAASASFRTDGLNSGVYFYRLQAGRQVDTHKVVVLE